MANDTVAQMKRLIGFLMDTLHTADQQAQNLAHIASGWEDRDRQHSTAWVHLVEAGVVKARSVIDDKENGWYQREREAGHTALNILLRNLPESPVEADMVSIAKVERLVDGLTAEDALTKHTAYRTGFNHAKQMMLAELRRLREGGAKG